MNLAQTIRQACDTMGVRVDDAREACCLALVAAAEHVYGDARLFEAIYDEDANELALRVYMRVVDVVDNPNTEISRAALEATDTYADVGEEVGFEVFYLPQHAQLAIGQDALFGKALGLTQRRETFGRIAIHEAKQALIHALRDAERAAVCDLYGPLVGKLVAGVVEKVGRHDHVTVSLGGGITGLLPRNEQHPRDRLGAGEWLAVEVASVNLTEGPPLLLTRTGLGMVRELLDYEIPELANGHVTIVAMAREAGGRCKVEVATKRDDVNAVAACIGEGGKHARALTEALLGERVDFIGEEPDEAQRVMAALHPAQPLRVEVDEEAHAMVVVVPDDQVALAVGNRAQNVRLASRLTGWAVSVVGESEEQRMQEAEAV